MVELSFKRCQELVDVLRRAERDGLSVVANVDVKAGGGVGDEMVAFRLVDPAESLQNSFNLAAPVFGEEVELA